MKAFTDLMNWIESMVTEPAKQPASGADEPIFLGDPVVITKPKLSKLRVMMLVAVAVAYFVWPLDVCPDIIPLICHADDLVVLGIAGKFVCRAILG